jgi:hypothetical protein
MKYDVIYERPKKKGYSKLIATILKNDDAIFSENYVKIQGSKNIKICPR